MTVYLIVYGANPTDRFGAYAYPTRQEAWNASLPRSRLVPGVPAGSHAGGHAYIIENAQDITFSGKVLVQVYLELTGNFLDVKMTRPQRVELLMKALENHSMYPDYNNSVAA